MYLQLIIKLRDFQFISMCLFVQISAGNGLDVDEYVRRAYKYAYSDCVEVGPVTCLPEPPDPNELYPRQSSRQAPRIFICCEC